MTANPKYDQLRKAFMEHVAEKTIELMLRGEIGFMDLATRYSLGLDIGMRIALANAETAKTLLAMITEEAEITPDMLTADYALIAKLTAAAEAVA